MEENNNNLLLKGLAILLIAILGLTVYRTETTKIDVAKLSKSVEALSLRLDSISQDGVPQAAVPAGQSVSNKQFNDLSKAVSALESKVNALAGATKQTASSSNSSQSAGPKTPSNAASTYGRVSVSAKVKVEDRYVTGTTVLPKVSAGPEGIAVIAITIDNIGIVTSAKVKPGSSITDEDILDACKEAALRTSFSYNSDAPYKQTGTITYTFTAK